jgi:hypothetical protein
MQSISTIGLDIAKSVFQMHGVDAGQVVLRRKRPEPPSTRTLPTTASKARWRTFGTS